MNFNLRNDHDSAAIKLGTCIVYALRQMYVKCYTVKLFIVEHNLSNKLNKLLTAGHMFIFIFPSFDVKDSTLKVVQVL